MVLTKQSHYVQSVYLRRQSETMRARWKEDIRTLRISGSPDKSLLIVALRTAISELTVDIEYSWKAEREFLASQPLEEFDPSFG